MDTFYFQTKGLAVGYHGVPLIRDIEIGLKRGEILTLIGPNGAGKTTVLKSIIRQLAPIHGTLYLDGRDLRGIRGGDLAQRLSVVLTARTRPELMTCGDVVATGRYPYTGRFGVLSAEDRRAVRESMELVHIAALADRDFSQVSDGQKQLVMLARALCQEPELLVLDEPTSFLDIRYKLEFLSILQTMAHTRGVSVIMSLHEIDLAGRISDQIACIHGDRVERCGPPEEILSAEGIRELYGLTSGSYDPRSGCLELDPARGAPEVFVLAGNGSGSAVYRRLQRAGIPFATGILWENDLDFPVARALAAQVIQVQAFSALEASHLSRARAAIDGCREFICAIGPELLTGAAAELAALPAYAREQGKLRYGI